MDVLRQFGAGERLSNRVVADVSDLAQTGEQAKRLKDTCVNADADTGVPGLDLLKGRTGREGALRHDSHWQPPTPTGIVDVRTELAQGAPHGGGRIVGCGNLKPSHYRLARYVARSLQYCQPSREGHSLEEGMRTVSSTEEIQAIESCLL